MSQPSATASVPHALAVAHQGLCRALDLGIQEFKQYHRFSNARQVCLAIERFVDEFCRVPEWRAQLEWRAEFVESNTGPGSAYCQAMDAALKACQDLPKKPLGPDFPIEGQCFSALLKSTAPLVLAVEVDVLRENLERVVDARVLNPPVQRALEEWLHQCRLIQSEAQHLQAYGCHYLYHVYQAVKPDASEWSKEQIRPSIQTGTFFGGARLEPMLVAADSLVAWAAENLACGSVSDLKDPRAAKLEAGGGTQQGPKQYVTGWPEIPDALGLGSDVTERGKIARLNKTSEGPIMVGGQGVKDVLQPKFLFACSGDGYHITGLGEKGHFKRLSGLAYLEKLLKNAGHPVLMVELAGVGQAHQTAADGHSRQPVLDEEAKKKCQEQLRELGDDIARAKKNSDYGEQERLEKERGKLLSCLQAATGLGGRNRDMNDPTAKLRSKIHMALGRAYKALREANPPLSKLADHFEANVSSEGPAFKYIPTPLPDWSFDQE